MRAREACLSMEGQMVPSIGVDEFFGPVDPNKGEGVAQSRPSAA